MLYHPTTISIVSIMILALVSSYDRIFKSISILTPLFLAYVLFNLEGNHTYSLLNIQIIANFEKHTLLIAYAFTAIILCANLYALGNHRKTDIILGSTYGALTYLALFAGDMISLIVALELMMVISSFIIFSGEKHNSIESAKRYFFTHLISGNMLIIGMCYLIAKTGSTEIFNLTSLINDPEYSTFIITIMFTGFIINAAAFPFSGWMVNCYPNSSASGFIYLISFTTKISVVALFKFFAGYELLKYIAIIMIIYSSIKAILENNLFSILCLLSIMQIGFMMIIISMDGHLPAEYEGLMVKALSSYLFLHILYKGLLSLVVATMADHGKIENCTEMKRIKNPTILFALFVGLAAMINIPASSTFIIKSYISHYLANDPLYIVIIFLSMTTIISLPLYRYIKSHETISLHLNTPIKIAIYCLTTIVFVTTFFAGYLPFLSDTLAFKEIPFFSSDSMKQLLIIAVAISIALFIKRARTHSKILNLTDLLGDIFALIYYYFDKLHTKSDEKEPLMSEHTGKQIIFQIQTLHNQQTAIFIVFTIFIILLISFITRGI